MNDIKKIYHQLKELWKDMSKNMDWTFGIMIFLILIAYVLIHDLIGETLFEHNRWDSYTLQAKAWLEGRVSLEQNYECLELAIYKDNYYVSFPPFPSVAMLPWVLLYGIETPNNLIMIIYVMIALTLVYSIARHLKMREILAAFWSVVIVLGCSMFWMSTMGGVWFQAQILNMILCLGAILAMLNNKRVASYICIALAVGCRPFSIVYFFVLVAYYYDKDKTSQNSKNKIVDRIKVVVKQWPGIVCAAVVGILYMIYNGVRFDNPFEFGHNYLPEFMESKDGQFNIKYIPLNLYRIFIRSVTLKKNMGLEFSKFNGFNVFIANPIFIIFLVCIIVNIIRKNTNLLNTSIIITVVANILCICMHKTLGGWHFGNRYMVDMIPFVMFYIFLSKKEYKKINKVANWERIVAAFAIMFNAYGIIFMNLDNYKR